MIKALLFDYDGVMTRGVDDNVPADRLATNLGISRDDAAALIVSVWDDYSTGKLSDADMWARVESSYGQPITEAQRDIWYGWDGLEPLPDMVALVNDARERGYRVGVVSNVLPVTARIISDNGGYNPFEFRVLSCEVGFRKPEAGIYQAALAQLSGIEPDEVLSLDDRRRCIDGALAVGMDTLLVADHYTTIRTVRERLLS